MKPCGGGGDGRVLLLVGSGLEEDMEGEETANKKEEEDEGWLEIKACM